MVEGFDTSYQQEVIYECSSLEQKLIRLKTFLYSDKFDAAELTQKDLLKEQYACMYKYRKVLRDRIEDFLE